ncbi:MAG TPA: PD-(D/E)XK nuclease family protein [Nitrospiraceae bacterium]|nr:PD-(D/E)XK nuclease family protein [Nitrospiraceae bacterium]
MPLQGDVIHSIAKEGPSSRYRSRNRVDDREWIPLNGNQRLVRTSERSAFKKCRWMWDLSFNQGLRQRRDGPALRFGSLIHEAMAEYYVKGRKRKPKVLVPAFIKAYERDVSQAGEFVVYGEDGNIEEGEAWQNARDLGIEMLEMYIEHYGVDKGWEVLATEQPFQVPVYNPRTGGYMFTYTGILDLIMREIQHDRIWIWDHKTTGSINVRALGLNEQFGSYWTFGTEWIKEQGLLSNRQFDDLSGLMVNYIRRARRDDRPHNALGQALNKDGSVSKRQQADVFHREPTFRTLEDRERVKRRAMNDFREMEMVRAGNLAADKSPSIFNCPSCPWLDACELHETGSDWKRFIDATTEKYDPYEVHEIEDAEKR